MNTHRSEKTDGDRISDIAVSPRPVSTNTDEERLPTEAGKVLDYAGSSAKTDPEEIKLVRKLDFWMLPLLFAINFLSNLQRQAISIAPLGGLNKDLGLAGTQFSTVVAVHSVGYILGQLPSNLLMTRVRPSFGLATGILLGAICTVSMVAVSDFNGLVLQRFFHGLIVAPVWAGTLYIASAFYKRKELGSRIGILYTSNILSTSFQGLIAAPIFSNLTGFRGLGGWQWMYVVFGIAAGTCGIVGFFVLPDNPDSTWWLTADQRKLAHHRMIADTVEKEPDVSIIRGLKQVVSDKYMWLFCLMHHIHTATSGFRNFLPTLFDTLGYDTTTTLVLTCPPFLLAAALSVVLGMSSGKYNERTWHLTALKLIAALGFIMGCVSMNTAVRLVGAFLFVGWSYPHTSLTLSWLSMTCGQTREKRAAALAIVNTSASAGLIWSPYLWPDTAAPQYTLPLAASAGMCIAGICIIWTIRLMLMAENKRIRREDCSATLFYAY